MQVLAFQDNTWIKSCKSTLLESGSRNPSGYLVSTGYSTKLATRKNFAAPTTERSTHPTHDYPFLDFRKAQETRPESCFNTEIRLSANKILGRNVGSALGRNSAKS